MKKYCFREQNEKTLYFNLPNTNGIKIKGILRGNLNQPLAIIMHGRPGSANELLLYLASHYLLEKGISSLRLFMYDFEPNTRNLIDCDLDTFVADFNEVVRQLRQRKVPKIFGIGHSYGGITVLKSKSRLDAAVLWDPTHGSYWVENKVIDSNFIEKRVGDLIIGISGFGYLSTVKLDNYDKNMGDTTNLAKEKGYPIMIISAKKGKMVHLGKKYFDVADKPKKHLIINANHQLDDSDKAVLKLLSSTNDWLQRYI